MTTTRGFGPGRLGKVVLLVGVVVMSGCGREAAESPVEPASEGEIAPAAIEGLTPEQAAVVVATVGDRQITVGEVTEEINRLSPYIRRRWAAPEKRREFLDKMIQIDLLSQEAERLGYGDYPEVRRAVEQVMIRLLIRNELEKELLPTTVDEERVRAEYEKDWNRYNEPTQYRVSEIVVADEKVARSLLAEIQGHSDSRGHFRELARKESLNRKSGERGGDVGYVLNPEDIEARKAEGKHLLQQNPDVEPEVARAIWTLTDRDQVYPTPLKMKNGYRLLMVTMIKPAMNRSFNSVRRLLENRVLRILRRERMDEFVAGLRSAADIRIHDENLNRLKLLLEKETTGSDELSPLETDAPEADLDTLVPGLEGEGT